MAKVKLTVGMSGAQSWNPGDEFECGADEAKRLIEAGYAVPLTDAKKETATAKAVKETRSA